MKDDSLGERIKSYENSYRHHLPNRLPIIIRIDGKSFHSYTSDCNRPFDEKLINAINDTMLYLCEEIQGVKFGYCQSDEISLLIFNPKFETQHWFNNNIQKMVSVSAGLASSYFTSISDRIFGKIKPAVFDSRIFVVPEDEVANTLIWRQQDCSRNSIQMLARSLYSHKECDNKDTSELQELCLKKEHSWNNLPTSLKLGRCAIKIKEPHSIIHPKTGNKVEFERSVWKIDNEIPIFSQDKDYINKHLIREIEKE